MSSLIIKKLKELKKKVNKPSNVGNKKVYFKIYFFTPKNHISL